MVSKEPSWVAAREAAVPVQLCCKIDEMEK